MIKHISMNYVSFKTSRNFCLGVVNIFYEWSNIIYRKLENMPLKIKKKNNDILRLKSCVS